MSRPYPCAGTILWRRGAGWGFSSRMRPKNSLLLLALLLGVVAVCLWRKTVARDTTGRVVATINHQITSAFPTSKSPAPASMHSPEAPGSEPEISQVWRALAADPANARAALDALALRLKSLPASLAAGAIRAFLEGHQNAATRLPFAIGEGGSLATAPTFRVWLLDQLGQLNPEAAANYAQTILASPENAEEWAVALRDYARVRSSAADADFLAGKMRELLGDPRWQAEASVGWLEAFDVAIHTHATQLTPELSQLLQRTGDAARPAAHAAFLTLDRLVLAEPVAMLGRLQAEPGLMKGREITRANYFSRADVRDPQQRALVEQYLLDPHHSPEELEKFTALYPNANRMISKNLLTPTGTPSHDDLAAHDREALAVLNDWLKDPRFGKLHPSLAETQHRVAEFVRQAR